MNQAVCGNKLSWCLLLSIADQLHDACSLCYDLRRAARVLAVDMLYTIKLNAVPMLLLQPQFKMGCNTVAYDWQARRTSDRRGNFCASVSQAYTNMCTIGLHHESDVPTQRRMQLAAK